MVKATSILMAGITFTGGLLLGFIIHLPGASSPHSRHPRSLAEPGSPTGSIVNGAPPVAVSMESDDVIMREPPVISSRSLLYLSIKPPNGESLEGNLESTNESEPSYMDASQRDLGIKHARRHFNGQSRRHGEGFNPRGAYVERKSGGKDFSSSPQVNLKSHQTNASTDMEGSAYKRVSLTDNNDHNNNGRKMINNNPPVAHMTDYNQKSRKQNSMVKAGKTTEHSISSDEHPKTHKQTHDTALISKSTNVDQYTEQRGPSTKPQGKQTLNTDIHGEQVNSEESVKMSVTVIDIAPGYQGASSSDTPLGSASNVPPRDLITGDDKKSLPNAKLNSQQVKPDRHQHMDTNGSSSSSVKFGQQLLDLVNGIYWSPQLEDLTPQGFGDIQTSKWRHQALSGRVKELREGCGRMQNRLVVFEDGNKLCARYRINTDQIQGEVYSYYLAQVLGIQNVPPAILAKADPSSPRWDGVTRDIDSAQWSPQKLLVLTPWLGNLQPVYIPKELQSEQPQVAATSESLVSRSLDELIELVQWSDLILLDYLTGNVDRMVNNMFNKQWNPSMMSAPTHNLERVGQAGPIVFLDNESGLLHSYRLLDKYSEYHEKLLRGLCVFRKSTVQQIKRLFLSGTISQELKERFQSQEPELARGLSFLPHHNLSVLNQRLAQVYRQILSCERRYAINANS